MLNVLSEHSFKFFNNSVPQATTCWDCSSNIYYFHLELVGAI